jgi:two-component system, cell cycle sensor histidine kinase and response regulator CckA
MGGVAAVEEIRALDSTVPVFVASGYADDPVMTNPVLYGFTASIPKPFGKGELAELLAKHLCRNE